MREDEKIGLLIVEDDANIRYLLEMAALHAGVFLPLAALDDGKTAIDWLQARDSQDLPDFILTDLSMPRMTGLELLRAVKADPKLRDIPVAIITSSNIPNDRDDAFAAGACGFVEKPHGLDALTKALLELRNGCADPHLKSNHAA